MYQKGLAYWYSGAKPWKNLGRSLVDALDAYRELEGYLKADSLLFKDVLLRYFEEGTSDLAPRTLKDYKVYGARLIEVFGHMPLEDIEPTHIARYHRARGKTAKVQANREKALISLVWNWARAEGVTALPNPCVGLHRHREDGRQVLVSDQTFHRAWLGADWDVRDVLDLALLTGASPADVLNFDWSQVHGTEFWVTRGKTGEKVRIEIGPELWLVLADIRLRRGAGSTRIVSLTPGAFDNRFEDVRRAAGIQLDSFQLRDLRAKAATEVADRQGEEAASALLAHSTVKTTKTYIRRKAGRKTGSTR